MSMIVFQLTFGLGAAPRSEVPIEFKFPVTDLRVEITDTVEADKSAPRRSEKATNRDEI